MGCPMRANGSPGSPMRHSRLKPLLWSVYLIFAAAASAVILAPLLGLGKESDFILYRHAGISRALALQLLLWPVALAAVYEILAVGVRPSPGRSRMWAVIKSAWADGSVIARRL